MDCRLVDPATDAVLSAFAPAGMEAGVVLRLFWVMLGGSVVVWIAVLAIASPDRLVIGASGLPYARTIAALFDPYRTHSPRRFSSAV